MKRIETQVVIAGAGPSGLSAAIELARWGVKSVIVERRTREQPVYPTANHLTPRTMEIFRQWGIADDVRHSGFPRPYPEDIFFIAGPHFEPVARMSFVADETAEAARTPESTLWCPRPFLDPVLLAKAGSCPEITLLHGAEIETRTVKESSVSIGGNTKSGDAFAVDGDYLLVAEGASSETRDQLGIELIGTELPEPVESLLFRCPNLSERLPGRGVQYWFLPPHPATIVTIDGAEIWRAHVPARALGERTIDDYLTDFVGPIEPIARFPWRARMGLATSYRSGDALLIGDAAHVVTPFGGMGMNLGIEDACNIGWKLGAVYQGWANEGLLESYESERMVCAEEVLRYQGMTVSDSGFEITGQRLSLPSLPMDMLDETQIGVEARKAAGKILLEDRALEFNKPGLELGFDYGHSPVICSETSTPRLRGPEDWVKTPTTSEPGQRATHIVDDQGVLFDAYGPHFTITTNNYDPAALISTAKERSIPIVHRPLGAPDLPAWRIMRPDGVIAACGDSALEPEVLHGIWDRLTGQNNE